MSGLFTGLGIFRKKKYPSNRKITPLGIQVFGTDGNTDSMLVLIDRAFVEALDCWKGQMGSKPWVQGIPEGKDLKVTITPRRFALSRGNEIIIDPLEPYEVIRHEWSHVVSWFAFGVPVKNEDPRCFLRKETYWK